MKVLAPLLALLLALLLGSYRSVQGPQSRGGDQPLPLAGFTQERFAEHDALIRRLTAGFNRDKAGWTGASAAQAKGIPDLQPALVKALFLQESGGGLPGDLAAWAKDPGQVNLPGNWSRYKADLGLVEPKEPNTGTPEGNAKAAIRFLARKGFGSSGRAPKERAGAFFDGWRRALERYNGRSVPCENGKPYRENYAQRILERAERPDRHAPIALPRPLPKPKRKDSARG